MYGIAPSDNVTTGRMIWSRCCHGRSVPSWVTAGNQWNQIVANWITSAMPITYSGVDARASPPNDVVWSQYPSRLAAWDAPRNNAMGIDTRLAHTNRNSEFVTRVPM